MHHPTVRIGHTFVTPVVEHWLKREIAQCVHPMKDPSDDPSHHERTLLPQSYISLPPRKQTVRYHFSDLQDVYSGNRRIHIKCQLQFFTPTLDINKWQMSL